MVNLLPVLVVCGGCGVAVVVAAATACAGVFPGCHLG